VITELIDVGSLTVMLDDNGQGTGDPAFAASMNRADAIILVAPEYNHAMPGLLKHVLDSCLQEYIHKAAGIVAVSAGPFGGTRVIETTLPVLRELGLATIFWDVNFGSVGKVFDDKGALLDASFIRRTDKFLSELLWMAKTLRYGREHITV
jgi:NAD(P)H-dependent FMN reductase